MCIVFNLMRSLGLLKNVYEMFSAVQHKASKNYITGIKYISAVQYEAQKQEERDAEVIVITDHSFNFNSFKNLLI